MKINEVTGLTGVKKYQDMSQYQFEQLMTNYGFQRIGGGSHAIVYRHGNEPYVYRITNDDRTYEKYAEFLVSTKPNIHYPKIYGIKNLSNFFKRSFNERWSKFNIVKVEYVPFPFTQQEFTEFDRVFRSSWMKDGILWSDADPQGKWRSLVDALLNIFHHVQYGAPDIHRANFAKRQDGSVVILDPLWEGESPYAAYDRAMKAETDWGHDDEPEYIKGAWNQKREIASQPPAIPQQPEEDIPF